MIVYENPWFRVSKEGVFHIIEENVAGEGAVVLPLVGEAVLLLEMRRPSQNGDLTLELPRGFGEAGDDALRTAIRELAEETGYEMPPEAFERLGYVRPNTGLMRSRVAAFVVRIDPQTSKRSPDEEAEGSRLLPLCDLSAAIADGQIEDGFTLSSLMLHQAQSALRR